MRSPSDGSRDRHGKVPLRRFDHPDARSASCALSTWNECPPLPAAVIEHAVTGPNAAEGGPPIAGVGAWGDAIGEPLTRSKFRPRCPGSFGGKPHMDGSFEDAVTVFDYELVHTHHGPADGGDFARQPRCSCRSGRGSSARAKVEVLLLAGDGGSEVVVAAFCTG
jgi:hypothetical protein